MPNVQGIGLAGLTDNYQRREDRTFGRHNFDAKVNFNRTSAHQLWFKYGYMDAVVDDLSNYLGPDPNATRTAASRRSTRPPAARRGRSTRRCCSTRRSGSRGRTRTSSVRTSMRATTVSTCSASRHQRRRAGRSALRRLPGVQYGLRRRGQSRRLEPDLPRRADVFAGANVTKHMGRHDIREQATRSTSSTSITGSPRAATPAARSISRATPRRCRGGQMSNFNTSTRRS